MTDVTPEHLRHKPSFIVSATLRMAVGLCVWCVSDSKGRRKGGTGGWRATDAERARQKGEGRGDAGPVLCFPWPRDSRVSSKERRAVEKTLPPRKQNDGFDHKPGSAMI